jgi:hypothetical protein
MRLFRALITLALCACAARAAAQDDRLPVIRPPVETVKASPVPFPFPDKSAADYDTWIRTPWIHINYARCGDRCPSVTINTITGPVELDNSSAKKGPAKMRLGLTVPASCGETVWYGEMRDQVAIGPAIADPTANPIDLSRVHLFRFDQRGREISMVFLNEHPERSRQVRLNVLCKSKT